jgi:hypothetical protein
MQRLITVLALLMFVAGGVTLVAPEASAAVAVPITINPDAGGPDPAVSVQSLDFKEGNSLSVGVIPAGGPPVPGVPFANYFQTSLSNFVDPTTNNPVPGLGLNSAYEWTMVAGFNEVATSITTPVPGQSLATFAFSPGGPAPNYLEFWYDPTPDANPLLGTGFNDGTLVLSASVQRLSGTFLTNLPPAAGGTTPPQLFDSTGTDQYAGQLTASGIGGIDIDALVSFVDPAFISPLSVPQGGILHLTLFNSNTKLPFTGVDPSSRMVRAPGGAAPLPLLNAPPSPAGVLGAINGISGPDIQFQADANAQFTVVPEPASLLVWVTFAAMLVNWRRGRQVA